MIALRRITTPTVREIRTEVVLPRSVDEVFAFFADAHNLNMITPDWLSFSILTPRPIEMREGALIDYRILLRGLPMRWRTRITSWQPPHNHMAEFVDEQLSGPYVLWRHTHSFAACEGGTRCRDRVEYAHRGGAFAERWLVRPDLERIFSHRQKRMLQILGK